MDVCEKFRRQIYCRSWKSTRPWLRIVDSSGIGVQGVQVLNLGGTMYPPVHHWELWKKFNCGSAARLGAKSGWGGFWKQLPVTARLEDSGSAVRSPPVDVADAPRGVSWDFLVSYMYKSSGRVPATPGYSTKSELGTMTIAGWGISFPIPRQYTHWLSSMIYRGHQWTVPD